MSDIDFWTFDLSRGEPYKPPKKDHNCPHDRKHPSGMEVCRACGDYGVCEVCGLEYIQRDIYPGHTRLCWPCAEVELAAHKLEQLWGNQRKRIAKKEARG